MSVDSSDEVMDALLGSNAQQWGMSKSDMEAKSFEDAKGGEGGGLQNGKMRAVV